MKMGIISVGVAGVVLLAGCGSSDSARESGNSPAEGTTSYPLTLRNCGYEVSVKEAPKRIVSTDQAMTEILIRLGVADRIVGQNTEEYPVAGDIAEKFDKIPVLGSRGESIPNEKLLEAQPDFVASEFGSFHLVADRTGDRKELDDLGVPTYSSEFDCLGAGGAQKASFDMLFKTYDDLGEILDVEAAARKLVAKQKATLAEGLEAAKGVTGTPSVLWFYSTYQGTPYTFGPNTLAQRVTEMVGARNVMDDLGVKSGETSFDAIAARNPKVIILANLTRGLPGDTAEEKKEILRKDPLTSRLDAVINNRFIVVPASYMDPSFESVDAVRTVAQGLAKLR